jgi:protocatechuate 3,4-dioxygenase alpha subunit
MPGTTPSQTVGPFFSICLPWPDGATVVEPGTEGAIALRGHVLDGDGEPVPDALVETWQAGPDGDFGDGFRGFGRSPTDGDGAWEVVTLKPGPVGDGQAPHIDVSVLARGLLDRVVTRVYFADEAQANAADPVLSRLSEAQRTTLIAERHDGGYRFDIHLQGADETTFFRF